MKRLFSFLLCLAVCVPCFAIDYNELIVLPSSVILDDNSPPSINMVESTGTGTVRFRTLDFDPDTDEIITIPFIVPENTAIGSWYVDVFWFTNDTGSDEDAIFAASVSATSEADVDTLTEQAIDSDGYATIAENCNSNEANRLIVSSIEVTSTYQDGATAGDSVDLLFLRDADDSIGNADNDGLTSDARVQIIRIRIPRS